MNLNRTQAIIKEFYLDEQSIVYHFINSDFRIAEYFNYYIGFIEPSNKVSLKNIEKEILLNLPKDFETIQFSGYYPNFLESYVYQFNTGELAILSNSRTILLGIFKRIEFEFNMDELFEKFYSDFIISNI